MATTIYRQNYRLTPARVLKRNRQLELADPELFGHRMRFFYSFDCRLEPGGNPAPVSSVIVHADAVFTEVAVNGQGQPTRVIDKAKSRLNLRNFLGPGPGAPLNAKQLQNQIDASFPPAQFDVPWPLLKPLQDKQMRWSIYFWVRYLAYEAQSTTSKSRLMIMIPVEATFFFMFTGTCKEVLPLGGFAMVPIQPQPRTDLFGSAFPFDKLYLKDLNTVFKNAQRAQTAANSDLRSSRKKASAAMQVQHKKLVKLHTR